MELAIIPQISNAPAELPEAEWSWNNMQEAEVLKTKEMTVGMPHFKNDVGYADAFATRYRGRIKFIAEEGVWLCFDDEKGWHRDKSGEVLELFTEYSRELFEQAVTEARNAEDQQSAANRIGMNERLLKSATGGDRQKGRYHYQGFVEFVPTAKIHLVGNHRPRITGVDDGIWRRFRLINWGVLIPEAQRDPRLAKKLEKEFPGILNWAIQGAIEWYSSGTQAPDSVIMATDEFREESDAFGDFLREKTVEEENGSVSVGHLFFCYKHYCDDQDTKPSYRLNKRSFGLKIASRGYTQGKINRNERAWKGIRVREQGDQ